MSALFSSIKDDVSGVFPFFRKILFRNIHLPKISPPKISLHPLLRKEFHLPKINLPVFTFPKVRLPRISSPKLPKALTKTYTLPLVTLPKFGLPRISLPKIHFPKIILPSLSFKLSNHCHPKKSEIASKNVSSRTYMSSRPKWRDLRSCDVYLHRFLRFGRNDILRKFFSNFKLKLPSITLSKFTLPDSITSFFDALLTPVKLPKIILHGFEITKRKKNRLRPYKLPDAAQNIAPPPGLDQKVGNRK